MATGPVNTNFTVNENHRAPTTLPPPSPSLSTQQPKSMDDDVVSLAIEGETEASTNDDGDDDDVVDTKDILLTSDERYEIWELKSVERPHLTTLPTTAEETKEGGEVDKEEEEELEPRDGHGCSNSCEEKNDIEKHDDGDSDDDSNDNDDGSQQNEQMIPRLPLIDGCDLPRWRENHRRLVRTSTTKQGYLNVGSGCTMLRRESQMPSTVVESRYLQKWKDLKSKLMTTTSSSSVVVRISSKNSKSLFPHHHHHHHGHSHSHSLHHPCWFEKDNVPVILDKDFTEHWKAYKTCTFQSLLKDYGDHYWRFSDTHGYTMTLRTYNKYIHSIEGLLDDAPLAVYDSQLHTDDRKVLLEDYDVPSCFLSQQTGDLFTVVRRSSNGNNGINNERNNVENCLVVENVQVEPNMSGDEIDDELDDDDTVDGDNENIRPPFRWILIGPERSGTGLHVDPLGTHAWVTLIEGMKRWVLFPYGTDPAAIGMIEPQIPSAIWFAEWYDKAVQAIPHAVDILQRPGETVYVPAGWPHLVLNLEFSTAITENYASEYPSFDRIDKAVKSEEPGMYDSWINQIKSSKPELLFDNTNINNSLVEEEKKEVE